MLFYSFFKSLVGKDVVVELKNDLSIHGILHSVDQYLNIKLTDISVTDSEKYPHMFYHWKNHLREPSHLYKNGSADPFSFSWISHMVQSIDMKFFPLSVKNCFIRGSVVRYVQLPADEVDTQLLQDAARKEALLQTR